MSKRIVVFNHKGGVGKTTSVYHLGWMLAKSRRVLLVDADPQCNLSSLLLGDDFETYFSEESTARNNIKDGVRAAFEAKPFPIQPVKCFSPARCPSLHLLAGHGNLSEYDAALTLAQTSNNAIATFQNLPGAFSELLRLTEERYETEITLIDLNPSLSSINQNLFVNSDAFIVPTNPDPFSIMAIEALTRVLPKWINWKESSMPLFADSAYPLPDRTPKFLGCLMQRFSLRQGKVIPSHQDSIDELKKRIIGEFMSAVERSGMNLGDRYPKDLVENGYCFEIPDFQSLLLKAFHRGVPVFELSDSEIDETGNVLEGLKIKRELFREIFEDLAELLESLLLNLE